MGSLDYSPRFALDLRPFRRFMINAAPPTAAKSGSRPRPVSAYFFAARSTCVAKGNGMGSLACQV
jgi:hypothetical protein